MNTYEYDGPVFLFDQLIAPKWYGQTRATSEAKAKSNLEYQYKKKHGYLPNAKIHIKGEIVMVM